MRIQTLILQRAREKYPHEHPRIISDNGPQFIARDSKEGGIRPRAPRTEEEANTACLPVGTVVEQFVRYYNEVRLHLPAGRHGSAIAYFTPGGKLAGRAEEIFAARDRKLEAARHRRAESRQRRRAQKTLEVAAATDLVAQIGGAILHLTLNQYTRTKPARASIMHYRCWRTAYNGGLFLREGAQ